MTLREALTHAFSRLYASPPIREVAMRDASLLLTHVLGIEKATLLAYPERVLTPGQEAAFQALVDRRLKHEPLQYILGTWEFYGLEFALTPAVLIPRPSTESLVEAVLQELAPEADKPLRIADVGTGSGAIAIALAHHLPNAQFTALDVSSEALEVAAGNAARHNLTDRIRLLQSDLLEGLPPGEEPYDAIVSNLPYIAIPDRESLHPQILDHEPHLALFGGDDGLDLYRRFIPQAYAALKPNGRVAFEFGHSQREPLAALLASWRDVRFLKDLERHTRAAIARKPHVEA